MVGAESESAVGGSVGDGKGEEEREKPSIEDSGTSS